MGKKQNERNITLKDPGGESSISGISRTSDVYADVGPETKCCMHNVH